MGIELGHYGLRHALARNAGRRKMARREREKLTAEVARLRAAILALDARVQETDIQIASLELEATELQTALSLVYGDSGDTVEPRQTFPKDHLTSWGGLTRTVLEAMRELGPGPLGASIITDLVAKRIGLEFEAAADYALFRRKMGRTLQGLFHRGYLERLHTQQTGSEGIWRLKASNE